jgi:hypothetical protein
VGGLSSLDSIATSSEQMNRSLPQMLEGRIYDLNFRWQLRRIDLD